jgi:hypothetical protein
MMGLDWDLKHVHEDRVTFIKRAINRYYPEKYINKKILRNS